MFVDGVVGWCLSFVFLFVFVVVWFCCFCWGFRFAGFGGQLFTLGVVFICCVARVCFWGCVVCFADGFVLACFVLRVLVVCWLFFFWVSVVCVHFFVFGLFIGFFVLWDYGWCDWVWLFFIFCSSVVLFFLFFGFVF